MTDLLHSLKNTFGFEGFRLGQKEVIEQIMNGDSALAVFPTGSGKSLCYQLPALHLPGLTIVVSPLIALMKDQIDFLRSKGVSASRLDSTLELSELKQLWRDLDTNACRLLYVAPERFGNEKFLNRLKRLDLSLLVIDEAHCMSEWGHNFRPDYMKLSSIAKELQVERVLALTATATPEVARDICKSFSISPQAYINTGYYRPNLTLKMISCEASQKNDLLLKFFRQQVRASSVVYVTLQKTTDLVADILNKNGFEAVSYHAGLKAEKRTELQERFMESGHLIVVATIAFGMGIDKEDIRNVFHYDPPKSLENYAQEIGRAGRDGLPATCEALLCDSDRTVLENFSYGDTPDEESLTSLLRMLFSQGSDWSLSLYKLSGRFDMRPLVITTLLCYLELEGVIRSAGPFYNTYKVKLLSSFDELLMNFDLQRQGFLRKIFSHAKSGRVWTAFDVESIVEKSGESRERITKALNYLEEKGMVEIQVTELYQLYKVLRQPEDLAALISAMYKRFLASEVRDIERINSIAVIGRQEKCLVASLLGYFGEDLGRGCGHCHVCLGEFSPCGRSEMNSTLQQSDIYAIGQICNENHAALKTARQQAKFLCGISSPATSRSRPALTKHKLFGSLGHLTFLEVLKACKSRG